MYKIKLFVPPRIEKAKLDLDLLEEKTGKKYRYCSRGRHAIYHMLKALEVSPSGYVVMPAYACPTIRDSILEAGLKYLTCDINEKDLNIDFDAFTKLAGKNEVSCVIVPSLYGNPADLVRFCAFCKSKNIKMIDDGAQSFGAKIDEKYVSTFGDAGFFAFSPGKATPGAMGALFWVDCNYNWKRTKHFLLHHLIYHNYRINRVNAYKRYPNIYRKILALSVIYLEKIISIREDGYCAFEEEEIGGVVLSALFNKLSYRNQYFCEFEKRFKFQKCFAIINELRGYAVHHKIALLMNTREDAKTFRKYLMDRGISTYGGYSIIESNNKELTIAKSIEGRVVELPIENSNEKMNYLFDIVENYCSQTDSY